MKTKEEIRQFVGKKRGMLKFDWVQEKSDQAARKLMALPQFMKAEVVCCYITLPGEVMTEMIVEKCWKDGKKVCVPAYRGETKHYDLACFEKNARLAEGLYGVPEPAEAGWVSFAKVDFVVVPGLAFDPSGGRVGHGGGYYDRILGGMRKKVFKAGLCFEFQVLDGVPMNAGDVRMDAVVTEKRVIKSAGGAV